VPLMERLSRPGQISRSWKMHCWFSDQLLNESDLMCGPERRMDMVCASNGGARRRSREASIEPGASTTPGSASPYSARSSSWRFGHIATARANACW